MSLPKWEFEPIPEARRAPCAFNCGYDVDIEAVGVHQYTSGWVMNRSGGGGHAISLPERQPRWAHKRCVEEAAKGLTGQQSMF